MDDKNRYLTENEILSITKGCMNKTFRELGMTSLNETHKGGLGAFIEEVVFDYPANSDNNPDFIDAGIELKVTPVKENLNGTFSSKERLVLNMINYNEEVNKTFEDSSFYHKNRRLLIWFYLWSKGVSPADFKIINYDLFEFERSVQYQTIKRDWEIINTKIRKGKAHEISESDTTFLAACTKGANSSILTTQPNSPVLAKPRAYSFKNGFMTRLYRELIHAIAPYVSFISEDEWMKNPLEEVYKEKLSKYYSMSVAELKRRFHLKTKAKNVCFMIAQRMLGLEGKSSSTQEMADAGIKLKTVRLNKNGVPYESMSFPAFDFIELTTKKWEESDIREDFVDWKLMFFVFQDDENGISRFNRVQFWNIPNDLVDGVIKDMYVHCAELVRTGNALYIENGVIKDYFPKEKRNSNKICHVRPHGRVKADVFVLPVPDKATGLTTYTKQAFWFNKKFIQKILSDEASF
ncbi:MAG: Sau3AI family type II restriction endonuclease [Bacilli bacterium]